jgi:ABC-type hemin transport system substrate-binding protein
VQVLEAIGGTPALKKGGPYQEMDTEDVVNLAPDTIIILRPRGIGTEPVTYSQAEIINFLGTLAGKPIPAVEKNRVAVIDDPLCLMPGSSLVEFANRLADTLKAWQ